MGGLNCQLAKNFNNFCWSSYVLFKFKERIKLLVSHFSDQIKF